MKNIILIMLLFLGLQTKAQTNVDSTNLENILESGMTDTLYYDSTYAHVHHTQKPGELTITKQQLKNKYRAKKFNKTEWKRIVEGANYEEEPSKKISSMPNIAWDPFILKVAGYILIFGVIVFLIFLFIKQALKDTTIKINQHVSVLFSDQTALQDIGEVDLEKLLREALAQKQLRIAVRLYYLKLLKHLNRQGYILWKKNKTNRDYANELTPVGISKEFWQLMIAYEYVWYGERTPSAEEFRTLQLNFENLFKTQRT